MSKRFVKFRDDADRKRFRAALADIVRGSPTPSREGAGSQRRLSQLSRLRVWFASGDPILEGILLDGKPVGAQAFKDATAAAVEDQKSRLAAMASAGGACFRCCAHVPLMCVRLSVSGEAAIDHERCRIAACAYAGSASFRFCAPVPGMHVCLPASGEAATECSSVEPTPSDVPEVGCDAG